MKKDRIVSVIFVVVSLGFIWLYIRERSDHKLHQIEADGCQAHKDLLTERVKKATREMLSLQNQLKTAQAAKPTAAVAAPGTATPQAPAAAIVAKTQAPTPPVPAPIAVSPVVVAARVSAVEKIIQLTPQQKSLLTGYFNQKLSGANPTQKFEDIIGTENADFYRQQAQKSFNKARIEGFEKEAYFLGSKLGLTPDQEADLISTMQQIDQSMPESPAPDITEAAPSRVTQLKQIQDAVKRNQDFEKELDTRMVDILTEDQLKKYNQLKVERSSVDAEMWH
jgi:hypothetical protein